MCNLFEADVTIRFVPFPPRVEGLFARDDGAIVTIADTTENFSFFTSDEIVLGEPAINEVGTVAFVALDTDGTKGLFTGPDPEVDKVIAVGDELFKSRVVDLDFSGGLNNAGQIVFRVDLANETSAIVRYVDETRGQRIFDDRTP